MANLTDTTLFRQINSETLMYSADNVDFLINGLSATYAGKGDVYTKDETYTKAEVNSLVAGAYHVKGSVATLQDLENIQNPQVGDVYNVLSNGKNYVYVDDVDGEGNPGWDDLGGMVDLTDYYTKEEVDAALSGKVDKVAGMGLSHNDFTDTLLTKLNGIADGAEVNQNAFSTIGGIAATSKTSTLLLSGGGATTVTPNTSTGTITISTDISGKVDKVAGMGLSHNDFDDTATAKLASIEDGAEVNQNAFSKISTPDGGTGNSITASGEETTVTVSGANGVAVKTLDSKVVVSGANGFTTVSVQNSSGTSSFTPTSYNGSVKFVGASGASVSMTTSGNAAVVTIDASSALDVAASAQSFAESAASSASQALSAASAAQDTAGSAINMATSASGVAGEAATSASSALSAVQNMKYWSAVSANSGSVSASGGDLTLTVTGASAVSTSATSGGHIQISAPYAFTKVHTASGDVTAAAGASGTQLTLAGGGATTVSATGSTVTVTTDISSKLTKSLLPQYLTSAALSALPTTNYKIEDIVTQYNMLVSALGLLVAAAQ